MEGVSIVIPFMAASKMRVRNLCFVVSKLVKCDSVAEIVVVEQEQPSKLLNAYGDLQALTSSKKFSYTTFSSPDHAFRKSALVNIGVLQSSSAIRRFWQLDADLYAQYGEVISASDGSDGELFVQPYSLMFRLNERETERIVRGEKPRLDRVFTVHNRFGIGGFIADKTEFARVGGMDERFIGWGCEDLEFGMRAEHFSTVKKLPFDAVHLSHPDSIPDENGANSALYNKMKRRLQEDEVAYLADVRSPFR